MKRSLMAALGLFLAACDDAAAPEAPSTTPTSTSASTFPTLTFTSTVTGNPVAGASVVVAGASYTTGVDGIVTLGAPAGLGATVDASAPGFLDRVTTVKAGAAITLWEIPQGADTDFVRQLAYNRVGTPEVLWRPTATFISLQLVGELASDPAVRAVHLQAATMATAMTGGRVTVQLGGTASGTGVFTILLNPSSPGAATTYLTQNRGAIQGGRVEYATVAAARTTSVVVHELGHVLGLGHAPSGIMCPSACGASNFGPLESAVWRSMWQRSPGTAPLDNDRGVAASSGPADAVISCDVR